jgi:hypothetical protein
MLDRPNPDGRWRAVSGGGAYNHAGSTGRQFGGLYGEEAHRSSQAIAAQISGGGNSAVARTDGRRL